MEYGDILGNIVGNFMIDEELLNDVNLKLDSKVEELCGELLILEGITTGDVSPLHAVAISSAQFKLAEVITTWLQSRIMEDEE